MSVNVERLRQLCERAMVGPWTVGPDGCMFEVVSAKTHPDGVSIGIACDLRSGDAQFIAAARTALPGCLDEIERLRERQQELLRDFARVTQQMPFPDEANQVPTLIAEVGTLRGRLKAVQEDSDAAHRNWTLCEEANDKLEDSNTQLRAALTEALDIAAGGDVDALELCRIDELRQLAKVPT